MTTDTQPKESPFMQALTIQVRVLGAFVLREMRVRYGRSRFGYFWALAEPVGYVAALTTVWGMAGRNAGFGPSLPLFFALGVIPFKMWASSSHQLMSAMHANRMLLGYPIVKELDTVFGRFILETLTSFTVLAICLFGIWLFDNVPAPAQPLRILAGFVLLAQLGLGIGLINACIVRRMGSWQNVFKILTAPMLFISGVFYAVGTLPTEAQYYLSWNPVLHGIEMVREGYYGHYRTMQISERYIFFIGLFCLVTGLFFERFYRKR